MPESLIALEGGIDNRSSSINASKGTLASCFNFEKDQGPGLVRRGGWCRYDGRVTGPEIEDAIVVIYSLGSASGSFVYGEQVGISAAGFPSQTAIYIGNSVAFGGYGPCIVLAYPIQTFGKWFDITQYPLTTTYLGLSSGAQIVGSTVFPTLMNDSSISIPMYDNIKSNIQRSHSLSVKAVPGRNESPIDAQFTFADNSYAIHDCITFTFNTGTASGGTVYPLEGHVIKNRETGDIVGKILQIKLGTGDWTLGNQTGQVVLYDVPLTLVLPVLNDRLTLMSADGITDLAVSFARWVGADEVNAPPQYTRALLYTTYEQYVKTQPRILNGPTIIKPNVYMSVQPPTWTRPRITRELPYTVTGSPNAAGFGPDGTLDYSIYEYTRQGQTTQINALTPLSTGELFPTVATDPSGGKWVNPNNIKVQDGAVASYPVIVGGNNGVSVALIGQGFDFSSIPDGSTILGVVFRVRAQSNVLSRVEINEIKLVSAAFPNGIGNQNKSDAWPPPVALTDRTYGDPNDQWGEQLNTTIVKDPTFGVSLKFKVRGALAAQFSADAYALTVYYAPTTRTVYVRDPLIVAAPSQDVAANIIHYCIDSGDNTTGTAKGVLTVLIGNQEYQGTSAGKIRRLKVGDEIRTAPSNAATNASGGKLLGYVAAEDYPSSFPPGYALDANISRYEIIDANFWATPDGRAAFIVNGAEYATMFDGVFTVRIRTGRPAASDNPRHVCQHGSPTPRLYLGFDSGSVVNTGVLQPLSTLQANGSNVRNFGEPVTGLMSLNGTTLGVWTDRSTRGLQGNDPGPTGNMTPLVISPAINCIEYSLVNLVGEAVWMSYRGVETVRTTNAYGDFETLPLSAAAQLWLQGRIQVDFAIGSKPSRLLYSIGVRNKRQYRAYFADGVVFTLTLFDAGDLPVCTTQQLSRPNSTSITTGGPNTSPNNLGVIRHIYNGTRSDGKEIILASFENQNTTIVPPNNGAGNFGPYFPYVVRIDCGLADDRAPYMPCWIELNSIYADYPTADIKFANMTVFMNAYGGSQLTAYTRTLYDAPIVDLSYQKDTVNAAGDYSIYSQTNTLPIIETAAYIPVPQRYMKMDLASEGRMIKILLEATQLPANFAPAIVPVRITHVSLSTSKPLSVDKT